MHFQKFRFLSGPNVYSHEPVLVGRLALEDYADTFSNALGSFNSDLSSRLPGLRDHCCGLGYPGGFLERLEEGTLLGHVIEHVAIELSQASELPVNHGKTRFTGTCGVYNVV